MANNKFKAAVKKAKGLYRTGRYKKFSDAVKAAYKKAGSAKKKRRKVGTVKRRRRPVAARMPVRRRLKRISGIGSHKKQLEKKLGNYLLEHWKTQSIKRTAQLDRSIAGIKKQIRSL